MHANQLVPQFLLKQSDTLPTQGRHIEHLHEEVWCISCCPFFHFYRLYSVVTLKIRQRSPKSNQFF